jgi:NAD(P)-dependent dehydrogenase (short-subunit alcohol dehydrogenase family)
MDTSAQRTALVTGANRGIGFEACRELAQAGLRVVLTARDPDRGTSATERLRAEGLDIRFEVMDVASAESVVACAERLAADGTAIDVLVNNAAIYPTDRFLATGEETMRETVETNLLGPFRTCCAFVPGMVKRGYGRVVNVSSDIGSINAGVPGPAAYGITKAALHALTRRLAREVRGDVKVNAMSPGWVRTDMGGPGAPRSVEQACDTLVWLATLPPDGPTDGNFRDRRPIPW